MHLYFIDSYYKNNNKLVHENFFILNFCFRLQDFRKSLLKMFQDKRSDTLTIERISDYLNSQNTPPFTAGEVKAALHKMADENKIMVADDKVFLI